jgi:hypothetical protein
MCYSRLKLVPDEETLGIGTLGNVPDSSMGRKETYLTSMYL